MSSDDESEATRLFVLESNREFNREFCGRKGFGSSDNDFDSRKRIRELTLELAESKSALADKQKFLDLATSEAKELRSSKKQAFDRYDSLRKEADSQRRELERLRKIEHEFNEKKTSHEFLLQNCRSVIDKFKTWNEFGVKQLEAMKDILVDCDRWNMENRYKIYFSYKSMVPVHITDDEIDDLAQGSIMDYMGIDDIDNIDRNVSTSRFSSKLTQTEEFENENASAPLNNVSCSVNNSALSDIQLSDAELNFLNSREKLHRLEQENAQLRDKAIVARDATRKQLELMELNGDLQEQNQRLKQQLQQVMIEKERLAENVQKGLFNDMGGPSKRASAREIIDRIEAEKERNDTLFRRTMEMETELAEAKAIITQINQSTATNNETLTTASLSTTINTTSNPEASVVMYHMRDNPLKAAIESYTQREAAKRRRIESGSTDAARLETLSEENIKLKEVIRKLQQQQEKASTVHQDFVIRYRENVRLITGYDIKMRSQDVYEASPIYDKSKFFSVERAEKRLYLAENDYFHQWANLAEKYIAGYDSMPCFFAAVIIQLREQPEETEIVTL